MSNSSLSLLQKQLKSNAIFMLIFVRWRENCRSCVHGVLPLPACLFTFPSPFPQLGGIKVNCWEEYFEYYWIWIDLSFMVQDSSVEWEPLCLWGKVFVLLFVCNIQVIASWDVTYSFGRICCLLPIVTWKLLLAIRKSLEILYMDITW
jgi:hypothetical protein